jgi:hypothetical protein
MLYRFLFLVLIGWSSVADATRITTGDLSGSTTGANPMISTIGATPTPTIRFEIGGASFTTAVGQLNVSIGVDALIPTVTSGATANQMFRDETLNAAYFGYFLTAGVKSASQPAANVSIKIRKGSGETSGRSYYLLGNGTTIPASQSDLTAVPASFTTIAIAGANGSHCGPNYSTNGLSGPEINCGGGSTVSNMDITQFVKVLDSDSTSSPIISQIELMAINE